MKRENLIGNRYGKLVVEEMFFHHNKTKANPYGRTYCSCKCDCGNTVMAAACKLKTGAKQSCGCDSRERRSMAYRKDIVGKKFNRLVVIESLYGSKVKCMCDCGNYIEASTTDVLSGHTRSCGCLQKENASRAVTKDFTGVISTRGVMMLHRHSKNKTGQWLWECECGLCGKHFVALPAKVINGHISSCGCRKQSSREQYIEHILVRENIDFQRQYTTPACRDKQALLFDFAIFDEGKLYALIEYDGQQHFKAVDLFGGEDGLSRRRRRDKIKNEFCDKNKIALYRLPYTMSDAEIEKLLMSIIYP